MPDPISQFIAEIFKKYDAKELTLSQAVVEIQEMFESLYRIEEEFDK